MLEMYEKKESVEESLLSMSGVIQEMYRDTQ